MIQPVIEVLIPTFNEAADIVQAVATAKSLGPVFVLDSFSTDGTQDLARAAGATVIEHPFTSYAAQKNWGLDNLPWQGKWIFILDADERITPTLRGEIKTRLTSDPPIDGFYINRLLLFLGQPIRHGGLYPSWNLRLFRRGKARYEDRSVHEHMVCAGPTDYLISPMLHVRKETISQYLAKHLRYADLESDEWIKWRQGRGGAAEPRHLFRDVLRFRQWIRRHVWPRMPLRPLWRFGYMYVARLGFLDGRAGWHVARLMGCYEYMIGMLYREKLQKLRTRNPAEQQMAADKK